MKNMIKNLCKTDSNSGIGLIRIIIGIVFMMHGSQKLFGLFGGGGLEGTAGYMASIDIEPSYLMALLAGSGEFFGGLLLLLGLFTRLGALATTIVCLVALFTVHISNGFFMSNNGFEYVLVLLISSISMFLVGGGDYSLDRKIFCQNLNKIDLKKCCK